MTNFRLLVLLAFAMLVPAASAQVTTGTPPLGTFGGGPDVINLGNLNSHITIPVFSKAGRGLPFSFYLTEDSSVWYPVTSNGTTSWQPVTGWGWNQSEANIGSVTYHVSSSGRTEKCGPYYALVTTTTYSGWTYNDGFHTSHPFPFASGATYDSCTQTWTYYSAQGTASDDSGYYLSVTGNTVNQLLGPDGSVINPSTGAGSVKDRNGNLISLSSNGVITDTLGQTALTLAGSGSPSSPVTLTYAAPSGASAEYTEKFTSYTVQTNFGCSGISEFGPTSENLLTEIDLPDIAIAPNDRYVITYEATPGHPGNVTGRIASISLPTGGTITYSYSGGSNGITCADGSTATLTRTVNPGGTWTYAHSENGTAWTTTVTDPQGNKTTYSFQGIYRTERKVYQGSSTLLEDDVTCYNGNTSSCNTTAITLPITERVVTDTLGSQQCKHAYFYNSYGLLTERDDYDYGNGAPGPLLGKELITYASLGNNIEDAPSQITIENGAGTVVAQTNYSYDQGSVVATSGTPQHVSVSGSRGNPTTISYLVSGSTYLTKTFTYFDTGNVDVATDVNNAQTQYTYADCGNSFPTGVSEPLNLSRSMAWNCTGGVQTSATDESSATTSTTWNDAYYWRPAYSTDPLGNETTYYYQPNANYQSPPEIASYMSFGNSITSDYKYLDGLGRTYVDQRVEAPGSGSLDSVSYTYDSNGRPYSSSGPCVIGWTGTCSGPTTTQTYDALNRPLVTTDGGGGTVTVSYSANDAYVTAGPAPSGENSKRRQLQYDGLGRLSSVCEITGLTGSGTCSQTSAQTGYWTEYSYDALGDLTGVVENAQSGSTQSRSYSFDGLGRMTSETEAESGRTTYAYDSDSSCGTSHGDLVKTVDAVGNVTCYSYDSLHRLTSVTYSGPYAGNTPNRYYVYDAATVDGTAMAHAGGRLAEAYTATCRTCSKITDVGLSYDARGELSNLYESTPHSSGYYHTVATYWANGVLDSLNVPGGYGNYYNVDGEGRIYSAANGNLTSTTYNAASQPLQVDLGSGDSDTFTYDPNTGRMTRYAYDIGSQSVVGNLTWNQNGSLAQLAITDPFNSADNQTCNYAYDDLSRIASANCGSAWSQTFSYDPFGNIEKSGSMSFMPAYSSSTNRMTSIGSFTPTYDANGNVTNDGLNSFAWDANGRPTTTDGVTVTYDALGRVVEKGQNGTNTEFEYSPTGFVMQTMNGQTPLNSYVPLPGGDTAVWGAYYYAHSDWLGSARFASTWNTHQMYNDLAYGPFGEPYAEAGNTGVGNTTFAGNPQNVASNLYDAQYREYGIQGRWPSPDPLGPGAFNLADPQSLDLYAYVRNDPTGLIDPLGLKCRYGPDGVVTGDDGTYPPCETSPGTVVFGSPDDTNPLGLVPGWMPSPGFADPEIFARTWRVGWVRPPRPPQAQAPKQPLLVCAAETANKYSLAQLAGTNGKSGFFNSLANGVLGNTFSTVTEFAYGGSSTEFGTTAYDFGTKATESSINAVTGAAPITHLGLGAESASQIAEGVATEGLGGIVTVGKLVYDFGTFAYGVGHCY